MPCRLHPEAARPRPLVALAVSVIAFALVRLSGDAAAIAGEERGRRTSKRHAGPMVSTGRSSSSISSGSGAPCAAISAPRSTSRPT